LYTESDITAGRLSYGLHDLIDTRSSVAVEQEPVLKNHETSLIETRGYEFFYFILFYLFILFEDKA